MTRERVHMLCILGQVRQGGFTVGGFTEGQTLLLLPFYFAILLLTIVFLFFFLEGA